MAAAGGDADYGGGGGAGDELRRGRRRWGRGHQGEPGAVVRVRGAARDAAAGGEPRRLLPPGTQRAGPSPPSLPPSRRFLIKAVVFFQLPKLPVSEIAPSIYEICSLVSIFCGVLRLVSFLSPPSCSPGMCAARVSFHGWFAIRRQLVFGASPPNACFAFVS